MTVILKNRKLFMALFVFSFLAIGIILLAISFYINQISNNTNDKRIETISHYNTALLNSYRLENQLRIQDQAWKNMLIRGAEEELYEKYLRQYRETIDKTHKDLERLLNSINKRSNAWSQVRKLFSDYEAYNFRYLTALPVYKLAEHDPHVTADKYVRKIETSLYKNIASIREAIKADYERDIQNIKAAQSRGIINILAANIIGFIIIIIMIRISQHINYQQPIEAILNRAEKNENIGNISSIDKRLHALASHIDNYQQQHSNTFTSQQKIAHQQINNSLKIKSLLTESIKLFSKIHRENINNSSDDDSKTATSKLLQKLQQADDKNRENIKLEQQIQQINVSQKIAS